MIQELNTQTKAWLNTVVASYGPMQDARNLLEIEARVGVIDLRHGNRSKSYAWSENVAQMNFPVSAPISNARFTTGLCNLSWERIDHILGSNADVGNDINPEMNKLKLCRIACEQSVCYEVPWQPAREDVSFLRETKTIRPPNCRLVMSGSEFRIDNKYQFAENTDVKLLTIGVLGDLRLNAQVESSQKIASKDATELRKINENQKLHIRIRKRMAYETRINGNRAHWLLHRTQVENMSAQSAVHELEFELHPESLKDLWNAWDNNTSVELINDLAEQMVCLCIMSLLPNPEPVTPTLLPFDQTPGDSNANQRLVARLGALTNAGARRFPGPNPVALETRHIGRIRARPDNKSSYMISEKSNGHRAIFAQLQPTETAKCVTILVLRDGQWYVRDDLPQGDTELVLDGELVFDTRKNCMTYVAFDVLAFDSQCLTRNTFEIRHKVLTSLASRFQNNKMMPILIKQWVYPRDLYQQLEKRMTAWRGLRVYDGNDMCHSSDGYICQPTQTPFVVGSDLGMFKYKIPQDITLDFCIDLELLRKGRCNSHNLVYYLENAEECRKRPRGGRVNSLQTRRYVPSNIGVHDAIRIMSMVDANQSTVVCEFRYANSRWEPLFIRSDKKRPNATPTVASTFVALQDHLTLLDFNVRICSKQVLVDTIASETMIANSMKQLLG
jgi:hypothetical protein